MKSILRILWNPRLSLADLKTQPRWIVPYFILAAVSIILYLVTFEDSIRFTLSKLPASANEVDRAVIADAFRQDLGARLLFLPIRLFVGWASFALFLFLLCNSWRSAVRVRFQQIIALEVHAEATLLLGSVCAVVLFWLRNDPNPGAWVSLPLGLDAVVHPGVGVPVTLALNAVNPFSVWYVIVLGMGIRILYQFRVINAFALVLVAWGMSVLFNVTIIVLLRDALRFSI
jgi:hypothetical protein